MNKKTIIAVLLGLIGATAVARIYFKSGSSEETEDMEEIGELE